MSRWISLIVLLVVIGVTGVVLYRVMASFILPMFLATVLAVIFRPLHVMIVDRIPTRPGLAALLSTMLILLFVLLPIAGIATLAVREGLGAVSGDVLDRAGLRITRLRQETELELPFRVLPSQQGDDLMSFSDIDRLVDSLPATLPYPEEVTPAFGEQISRLAEGLNRLNRRLDDMSYLATADTESSDDDQDETDMKRVKRMLTRSGPDALQPMQEMQAIVDLTRRYVDEGSDEFPIPHLLLKPKPVQSLPPTTTDETGSDASVQGRNVDDQDAMAPAMISVPDLRRLFTRVQATYAAFRIDLLGGPFWSWLTDLANPGSTQIESLRVNLQTSVRGLIPSVAGQATAIVGSSLLGLAVMTLSVFYFLKDGPSIMKTMMKLSPLEDRYEEELVVEFESVSRAVVLATLLSALAQGVLAGIAYLIAGFDSIFLLTALTMVLAMVPFIGAAAIWVPACLWLALVDERFVAAFVLFGYGAGVISMADNVIKPIVLHGQSKLHPLLALLSVLGGVQALGPIGILVGPMVVSFLQALLNILHNEMQAMDEAAKPAAAS